MALTTVTRALVAAVTVATLGAAGCSFRERVCGEGMYPAVQPGSTTGRTCVRDGADPPEGYVRFPAGQVPEHVDDEWDKYWRSHVIDENGNVSPA